jgi:hypothetical protein
MLSLGSSLADPSARLTRILGKKKKAEFDFLPFKPAINRQAVFSWLYGFVADFATGGSGPIKEVREEPLVPKLLRGSSASLQVRLAEASGYETNTFMRQVVPDFFLHDLAY